MIHEMSERMVEKLLMQQPEAVREDAPVYVYGAECLINELLADLLLILVGLVTSKLGFLIVWDVAFTLLRIHIGGFHASSHGTCIVLSVLLGAAAVFASGSVLQIALGNLVVLGLCYVSVCRRAPLSHPAHPLSPQERGRKHRIAVVLYGAEYGLCLSLYVFARPWAPAFLLAMDAAVLLYLLSLTSYRNRGFLHV